MKIKKKYKTLNYKNLKIDAFKCLSPAFKKLSSQNISSNIKTIKSMFNSFDLSLKNTNIKNKELVKENDIFKQHLHKYYSYKNFLDNKQKHKNKNKISEIDNLKIKYFNKGYKIPKISNNLFKISPLILKGISIKNYFNELYRKEKKEITLKEKNIDFLNRLQNDIKEMKINKNSYLIEDNLVKSVNISPNRRFSIIKQNLKKANSRVSIKSIKSMSDEDNDFESENKEITTENKETVDEKDKKKYLSDYDKLEEDEYFKELNEYEKNRIIKLLKEEENVKNYNKFIINVLKDKNYFKTIDTDDIEFNNKKEEEVKDANIIDSIQLNSSKTIKKLKRKSKISISNSDENSYSSEDNPIMQSSQTVNIYLKTLKNNYIKPNIILTNNTNNNINNNDNKNVNSRNIKTFPKLKKSRTLKDIDKIKNQSQKNQNINYISYKNFPNLLIIPNKKNDNMNYNNINKNQIKKFSYSLKPQVITNFLKTINEEKIQSDKSNRNMVKNSKIFNKFNANKIKKNKDKKMLSLNFYNINNNGLKKNNKFLNKEESLNYLFKRINSEKNLDLDNEFINEYKRYFIKNKNISEDFLNKYIERKYNIKDFINLCLSIDEKIKKGNVLKKWKKNYLRIGKFEEIKPLLQEQGKQDYFINHLLQCYMNSKNGKRNYYDYDIKDIDSIEDLS